MAAGLSLSDLDTNTITLGDGKPIAVSSLAPSITSLRQMLTWQLQLTSTVPITSLKILHRWAKDDNIKNHPIDISTVLQMVPKYGFPVTPSSKSSRHCRRFPLDCTLLHTTLRCIVTRQVYSVVCFVIEINCHKEL